MVRTETNCVYLTKLINGEILVINADGYDVFHHGKFLHFYIISQDDKFTSKICEYIVPSVNILYIRRGNTYEELGI